MDGDSIALNTVLTNRRGWGTLPTACCCSSSSGATANLPASFLCSYPMPSNIHPQYYMAPLSSRPTVQPSSYHCRVMPSYKGCNPVKK